MKNILKPLLTGLIAALLIVLVMVKITMNFQILLIFGAAIFFILGLINSKNDKHYLITALSIVIIYETFFILIVLKELPGLWYFVPVFILSAVLGVKFNSNKSKGIIYVSALSSAILFVAFYVIPNDLEKSLTKERYDKLAELNIQLVNGEIINSKSLEGKIVVLDFFGTWCKPCILELKELEKIKTAVDETEVVFFIINADQGGDTPEKFDAFINKNNYTFNYAYDNNSEIFKQLKMAHLGLPTLLIIDKEQNIRLQHVGYNPAETNFTEHMIETISKLK